jgi:parvulin-like peptidyl-prolyl isomerase
MASSTRTSLSAEKEIEAQVLAQRIRELTEEEFLNVARLLVSKPDREIFGDTEFEVRDILLKAGAKAFEEYLRQKKTATTAAASTVPTVSRRPNSKASVPSRR